MRYLVTGGLGVVGSRFVELVASNGDNVTIIDCAEEPRNLWTLDRLNAKFGDLITTHKMRVENTDFTPLLKNHDAVLHAAAHTGIPHSEKDPNDDWISNVDATRNILEAMRKSQSTVPVVMLSSVKPYRVHDIPCYESDGRILPNPTSRYFFGVDETCLLEPDEPYAASKMAQSALAMAYGRTYDLSVVVLRCSNLYGDAPCHGPRHGWLTWFCISAILGIEIELQGSGCQTRDMLFSDDVASATHAALKNIDKIRGNVYNIGGGSLNTISCLQAVALIRRILGREIPTKQGPGRKNEDMLFLTNHQRFTAATDWKPSVNVEQGIRKILIWAESHKEELRSVYKEVL